MAIKNTTLDAAPTAIYTSAGESAVTTVYFCNKTPGTVNFNLYIAQAGQPATDSNMVYYDVAVSPKDTYILDTERIILSAGDGIYASATASNSIVATVSYVSV